jgi:transcriptional regulator of met regulon
MKLDVGRGEVYGTWTHLCTERSVRLVRAFRTHTAMSLCCEAFVLTVIVYKKRVSRRSDLSVVKFLSM